MAAPLFGWISDTWGRLRALTLSLLLVSLAGSAGALTGSAWGLVTETQGLVLYTLTRSLDTSDAPDHDSDQVPDRAGGHGLLHDQLRPDGGACQHQTLRAGRDR